MQRLFPHRAPGDGPIGLFPAIGIERPFGRLAVPFETALQEPGDCAFGAADRTMQHQHAAFAAVLEGRAFEDIDQFRQRLGEAEDRVLASVVGVVEEAIPGELLLPLLNSVRPVRGDHVVQSLVRCAGDLGVAADEVEVLVERAFPVLVAVFVRSGGTTEFGEKGESLGHGTFLLRRWVALAPDRVAPPLRRDARLPVTESTVTEPTAPKPTAIGLLRSFAGRIRPTGAAEAATRTHKTPSRRGVLDVAARECRCVDSSKLSHPHWEGTRPFPHQIGRLTARPGWIGADVSDDHQGTETPNERH